MLLVCCIARYRHKYDLGAKVIVMLVLYITAKSTCSPDIWLQVRLQAVEETCKIKVWSDDILSCSNGRVSDAELLCMCGTCSWSIGQS